MITSVKQYESFDLVRLLKNVFVPITGSRVAFLIDLDDPTQIKDFAFLKDPAWPIQHRAHEHFYQAFHNGGAEALEASGGEMFAYKVTGGSNLDMPDEAWTPEGKQVSLSADVYANYDLILAITSYSATAPLTAHAKHFGFRGATLHGLNDIILASGLSVDYNDVSSEAEKLRLGYSGADWAELDFVVAGNTHTLRLILNGQDAQKSHGLCHGTAPDVANLPAGEVYFVPEGAEGEFPMKYEADGTLAIQKVTGGRIVDVTLVEGNPDTVAAHKAKLASDPVTGEIGELGFGTQELPFCDSDIQDEKRLGTVHVATGRSDHLGGHLVPGMFAEAMNASHDDILFHPNKTPEIGVPEVRLFKDGKTHVVIENYKPVGFALELLQGVASE